MGRGQGHALGQAHPVGVPAVLYAHGRPARGDPAHDDPQELWLHALHRRARYGGIRSSVTGDDFYGAYEAQDIAKANADELGVQAVPSLNLVYTEEADYVTADEAKEKNYSLKKLS